MLTHQIVITLTPALSLEGRGRQTNPHSLLSTFVSNLKGHFGALFCFPLQRR